MDRPIAPRPFPFLYDVTGIWTIDKIPLRFPNDSREYRPIYVEGRSIIIDIRRNPLTCGIDPPLNSLNNILRQHPTYSLSITISWKAVAFSASRWAPPPWTKPIGPDICADSIKPLEYHIDALIHHIVRWKDLRIFCPLVPHLSEKFSCIAPNRSPQLESIVLMDIENPAEIKGLTNILRATPKFMNTRTLLLIDNRDRNMRNVAPDPFSFSVKDFPFLPPFGCWLISLRVDYQLSAIDAWSLLMRMNHLVECVFNGLTGTDLIRHDMAPAMCGSLRYLKLSNYDGDVANFKTTTSLHSLLKNIFTPRLQKLVLKGENKWDSQAFASFITRSFCTLDSLHIINMGINPIELVSCLELAGDSLTDLLLEQSHEEVRSGRYFWTPHFLNNFTYHGPQRHDRHRSCLCPKLNVISIGDLSLGGSGKFGLALLSRLRVTPLAEVRILTTDTAWRGTNIQAQDVKELQELTKRGVRVVLTRDPCDGL
jgi:hypothetical protein